MSWHTLLDFVNTSCTIEFMMEHGPEQMPTPGDEESSFIEEPVSPEKYTLSIERSANESAKDRKLFLESALLGGDVSTLNDTAREQNDSEFATLVSQWEKDFPEHSELLGQLEGEHAGGLSDIIVEAFLSSDRETLGKVQDFCRDALTREGSNPWKAGSEQTQKGLRLLEATVFTTDCMRMALDVREGKGDTIKTDSITTLSNQIATFLESRDLPDGHKQFLGRMATAMRAEIAKREGRSNDPSHQELSNIMDEVRQEMEQLRQSKQQKQESAANSQQASPQEQKTSLGGEAQEEAPEADIIDLELNSDTGSYEEPMPKKQKGPGLERQPSRITYEPPTGQEGKTPSDLPGAPPTTGGAGPSTSPATGGGTPAAPAGGSTGGAAAGSASGAAGGGGA